MLHKTLSLDEQKPRRYDKILSAQSFRTSARRSGGRREAGTQHHGPSRLDGNMLVRSRADEQKSRRAGKEAGLPKKTSDGNPASLYSLVNVPKVKETP